MMKSKLEKLLPRYAWLPVATVIVYNLLVHFVTSHAVSDARRHTLFLPIDRQIPLVPVFVVFYVLAFAQWFVGYFMAGRESRTYCNYFCHADIIGKTLCLICFIVYPTILERPSVNVTDFFTWLMKFIYTVDKPVNCFPSIHVMESWVALRAAFAMKKTGKVYFAFNIFAFIMCIFSILYTRQHYVIDIPAGILVAELGFAAAKRMNNERFLWLS